MSNYIRVLSQKDVEQILKQGNKEAANEIIDLMVTTFSTFTQAHQTGNTHITQAPQRISVDTDRHRVLFMPSRFQQTTSVKVVSVPTKDGKGGLPATVLVLNEDTGSVQAVMNASALTAVRTAAGSGVATRYFANPESKNLVVLGAGAQGRSHIDIMIATRPSLEHITIWNRGIERRNELIELMKKVYPNKTFIGVGNENDGDDLRKAVEQADIICTCTNASSPVLKGKWLKSGVHLNCVGSYRLDMHEVDSDTIKRTTTILVDSIEACGHEAGELVQSSNKDQWTEIGSIVLNNNENQQQQLRYDPNGISLFKSVGISVQDSAIAELIVENAKKSQLGNVVPF